MEYKGFLLPDEEFYAKSFKFIIDETHYNKLPDLKPDDIVMDVGACIGTVIKRLAPAVQRVVGYEPHPYNFHWLQANCGEIPNAELVEALVVSGREETQPLYLSKHVGAHSVYNRRLHDGFTEVRCVNFQDELDRVKPSVLVMDIEAGEYELTDQLYNLPEGVKTIAIEIHLGRKAFVENARQLISSFEAQGFNWVLQPDPDKVGRFTGSFTNAIGVRD